MDKTEAIKRAYDLAYYRTQVFTDAGERGFAFNMYVEGYMQAWYDLNKEEK